MRGLLPPPLRRVVRLQLLVLPAAAAPTAAGGNCIKIGLPGKLILSERKGLREVLFSLK